MTLRKINKTIIVDVIPFTFNSDKLNMTKIAKLDIFFQCIANEIREDEELKLLNT